MGKIEPHALLIKMQAAAGVTCILHDLVTCILQLPSVELKDISANAIASQVDAACTTERVAMPVVPVKIRGNREEIESYANC